MKEIADRVMGTDPSRSGLKSGMTPMPSKIYPLSTMLNELVTLADDQWGLYAFGREPLRSRFIREQRIELAKKSMSCGREFAQRLKAEYGTLSPAYYAKKMGISVEFLQRPNDGSQVIFAQFAPPATIRVYEDCLKKAGGLLEREKEIPIPSTEFITDILIAHELFHVMEEKYAKEIFTRTEKVTLWTLGPVRNRSHIACLSEIAGMAFAQELCGAKFSPYLLDVFLVYGYQTEAASNLYEDILKVTKQPSSAALKES